MILFGASGHGLNIMQTLFLNGETVSHFIDEDKSKSFYHGLQVNNQYNSLQSLSETFIISIGDNVMRKKKSSIVTHKFGICISPYAILSKDTEIGKGSVVFHNAVIQSGVTIGDHVIINTSSSIDHECKIDNFVHISPGAVLCGNILVGEGTQIGAGAIIIPGIKIGKWCTIGAGAIVIRNVPDYSVVVGNPGKIIKTNIDYESK